MIDSWARNFGVGCRGYNPHHIQSTPCRPYAPRHSGTTATCGHTMPETKGFRCNATYTQQPPSPVLCRPRKHRPWQASQHFPKPKVTSLSCFICPTYSSKPKDSVYYPNWQRNAANPHIQWAETNKCLTFFNEELLKSSSIIKTFSLIDLID